MTAAEFFRRAALGDTISTWVFRTVALISAILLFPQSTAFHQFLEPVLIALAVGGIVLSMLIRCWQNAGNSAQRATHLTNALGVALGDPARAGYYNNRLRPSVYRLAATTFENSIFTSAVLEKMLTRCRIQGAIYIALFILLLAYRGSDLSWLLFLAQTLFSADVALRWLQMERFSYRTKTTERAMRQFFLQLGTPADHSPLALTIANFADYECAKDEAAMPLDSAIFSEINTAVSEKWNRIRAELKIDSFDPILENGQAQDTTIPVT